MTDNIVHLSAGSIRICDISDGVELTDIDVVHGILGSALADGIGLQDILTLFTCGVRTISDLQVAFNAFSAGRACNRTKAARTPEEMGLVQ